MIKLKAFLVLTAAIFAVFNGQAQTSLTVQDTRAIPTTPGSYSSSFEAHFKEGVVMNLPSSYHTILGLRGWSDNSGGKSHELAFDENGQISLRSGYDPTWGNWRKLVIADEYGNVGVGTADTKGYKLAVAGNMVAESVKVKLQGAWPDYVFLPSYKVPTLQEIEKHIKEKGHLPGIPSAGEVKANGVDLGEMNAKLLQKIEELTLHLIEQKKDMEQENLIQMIIEEKKVK